MDKETGFFVKDTDMLRAKMVITSKSIKLSGLELAWRIGITIAVVASIVMQVL